MDNMDKPLSSKEVSEKVMKYESFLNETLKEDLRKLLEEREKIFKLQSEYMLLQNQIERIQADELTSLRTTFDLGCNCYCQAKIPDTSKVIVLLGLGVYAELKLSEATAFIDRRIAQLTSVSNNLTTELSKVKAHIRVVAEGLREIQGLSDAAH